MRRKRKLHLYNLSAPGHGLSDWFAAQGRLLSWVLGGLILIGMLAACAAPGGIATLTPSSPSSREWLATFTPTIGVTPSSLPGRETVEALKPTSGITPSSLPTGEAVSVGAQTAASTPSPPSGLAGYTGLSIDELTKRTYGSGLLEIQETLAVNSYFTRTLITYPSDGLQIYGFMNIPRLSAIKDSEARFPVIIALHGYIDPAIYKTLDYTTRYADALARYGFLVIHPNLRGYPPSDEGDNRFRVGMAIDVLNLIALIKEQAGQPGPLEKADPQAIGLWGHSMGGGVATRVITVSKDIGAVLLYGAMSGDDRKNYARIFTYFSSGARGLEELQAPEEVFEIVSPINYLERIQAAVSIHHGKEDPDVPLAWSLDLCQRLKKLGRNVECFTYPGQPHTFHGEGDDLLIQRTIQFFNKQLRPQ